MVYAVMKKSFPARTPKSVSQYDESNILVDTIKRGLNSPRTHGPLPSPGDSTPFIMTLEAVISGAWKHLPQEIEKWAEETGRQIEVRRQMRMLVCKGCRNDLAALKDYLASEHDSASEQPSPFESAIFPPLVEGGKRVMLRGDALARERQIVSKLPCLASTPRRLRTAAPQLK